MVMPSILQEDSVPLSEAQWMVLLILDEEGGHIEGNNVGRVIADKAGTDKLSASYASLADRGLVDKTTHGKRTTSMTLTQKGKVALSDPYYGLESKERIVEWVRRHGGSLEWEAFGGNPYTEQIAEDIGTTSGNVTTQLRLAVNEGLLLGTKTDGGVLVGVTVPPDYHPFKDWINDTHIDDEDSGWAVTGTATSANTSDVSVTWNPPRVDLDSTDLPKPIDEYKGVHVAILKSLDRAPDGRVGQDGNISAHDTLADLTDHHKATISKHCRDLEADGLIERGPQPMERGKTIEWVRITSKGRLCLRTPSTDEELSFEEAMAEAQAGDGGFDYDRLAGALLTQVIDQATAPQPTVDVEKLERYENQFAALNDELDQYKEAVGHLKDRVRELAEEKKDLQGDKDQLQKQLDELRDAFDVALQQLEETAQISSESGKYTVESKLSPEQKKTLNKMLRSQ